uniref:Uncharacterized protein n=1 Tax=Pyricularia oryzae (strain P131) TaxID=1143193 RepID=L7JQT2_PYRO1
MRTNYVNHEKNCMTKKKNAIRL